jgi:hypothetical protein
MLRLCLQACVIVSAFELGRAEEAWRLLRHHYRAFMGTTAMYYLRVILARLMQQRQERAAFLTQGAFELLGRKNNVTLRRTPFHTLGLMSPGVPGLRASEKDVLRAVVTKLAPLGLLLPQGESSCC